jgi:hypothetical protein
MGWRLSFKNIFRVPFCLLFVNMVKNKLVCNNLVVIDTHSRKKLWDCILPCTIKSMRKYILFCILQKISNVKLIAMSLCWWTYKNPLTISSCQFCEDKSWGNRYHATLFLIALNIIAAAPYEYMTQRTTHSLARISTMTSCFNLVLALVRELQHLLHV